MPQGGAPCIGLFFFLTPRAPSPCSHAHTRRLRSLFHHRHQKLATMAPKAAGVKKTKTGKKSTKIPGIKKPSGACVGGGGRRGGGGSGARGGEAGCAMRGERESRFFFLPCFLSRPSPSSLLPTPTPQAPTSTSGACPRAQGDPLDPSPCVTLAVGGAGGAGDGAGRVTMGGSPRGAAFEEAGRERGRSALHPPPPRSSPLSGGRMGTGHPPRPPPQWVVRLAGHPLGGRAGGRQQASAELLGPARMGRGVSFPP